MLSWHEFVLRLAAAGLAGALIGFERQWRSRGAGLRTNTLVAAGAAIFGRSGWFGGESHLGRGMMMPVQQR